MSRTPHADASDNPSLRERFAQHRRLSHALEQAITNVLYAILVGGICVVLFS